MRTSSRMKYNFYTKSEEVVFFYPPTPEQQGKEMCINLHFFIFKRLLNLVGKNPPKNYNISSATLTAEQVLHTDRKEKERKRKIHSLVIAIKNVFDLIFIINTIYLCLTN